jgi:hypothetical protein
LRRAKIKPMLIVATDGVRGIAKIIDRGELERMRSLK